MGITADGSTSQSPDSPDKKQRFLSEEDMGFEPEGRSVTGMARDIAGTVLNAAISVPEAVVGLADIPTGGRVGKFLEEKVGFKPAEAKHLVNENIKSDQSREAHRKFEEAEGFVDKAKTAIQNPSLILEGVGESLGAMGAGGVAARGLMAATRLGQAGAKGAAFASAAGEGAVMAGAQAAAIRQETEDGLITPVQSLLSVGTGVLGGAFGAFGNRLSQKLGVGDADIMIAQGAKALRDPVADPATAQATQTALRAIPAAMVKGAIAEGVFEELPQSVTEQILQNIALGDNWTDDLDSAVVMGVLTGGAMGAGAAGFKGVTSRSGAQEQPVQPGAVEVESEAPAPTGKDALRAAFIQQLQEQARSEQGRAPVLDEERLMQAGVNPPTRLDADRIDQALDFSQPELVTPKPSEQMGIDPNAGPLSAGAAHAVDSGVSDQLQQQQDTAAAHAQAKPESTESEVLQTAAQDAIDMKAARQKVEKASTTVDPETGEILGVQLAAEFADWSDEQLRNAFKSAQGKSVRQELAVELQSRRARREQEALQAELDEDLAAGEMPDVADGAFASVQEDAGPVPARIEVQGGGESSPLAPGSKAKGANLATLAQLNRKKLAEMTTGELHQLASLLPGEHGRQEKIQKAIQARATAAQPATTEGATANGATATQNNVSQDGTTPTTQAQPQAVDPKQRITDAGAQWARMPAAERSALAARLDGVAPVIAKNLPKSQWEKLNSKLQGKIADAIKAQAAPVVGDEKAFAPETGTLGIPRADMPQVPTANHGGLVKHLNAQGIGHETKTVDAAELKPTQAEYSPSKVAAAKTAGGDRAVIVTSDGHIIDGHHQAVGAAEDGKQVKAIVLDAPVEQALAAVKASPSANQVPKTAVKKVAKSPAAPRAMNDEGRAVDGDPIMPGDTFTTSSGRSTSPHPKQKGERYASQWLIDNAVAEAESRGDTFNAPIFKATTLLKSGVLTDSDRESMLMYLFGEQPAVVPSILKPMAPFANSASNLTGNSADAAPEATGKEANTGASATNDRDHFTLMRANDGGDVAPVTFARGETVKIAGTQKPYGTGVITGISHAERKFRVDGQQHGVDFGYAYPADYDEFAKPRAEVDKGLDRLAQRLAEENAIEAQKFIEAAKSVIKLHNLGDYAKARMAELTARAAEISQSVVDKMRAARERKAAEDAAARETEKAKAKPEEPVRMTMEEWKAASKDFKSIVDGQRMVMREGGMRKVVIEKPNSVSAKKLRGVVAKAAEAKIAEISADYLNGAVQGDTITASKDFDYVRGGVPLLVESISPRGDVHVFDPVDGGRTSFKADMAAGRRVTFTVEKAIAAPEPIAFLARHNAIEAGISAGTLNLDEYKSAFADLETNRDAVVAELEKLTKDELLRAGGTVFAYRNKGEKKADIVAAAYAEMMKTYALGRSYGPSSHVLSSSGMSAHRAKQAEALRELVANTTAEDLSKRAAEIKSIRDEFKAEREAKAAALASPKTLQDFRGFLKHWIDQGDSGTAAFLRLTPEQRQQFDALEAAQTKEAREAAKRKALTSVQSAGNTTAGEVVATKHTKKGHDLFVVALADRVERDAYDTLNASAKQLGGSYSSYRGNGAIPGFQFRTREAAEAFQKLMAGDTTQAQELASQRRDAFDDDKSQSAAERLRTMAEALDERAADALGADRKVNTERRARFAASAEAAARMQQALAGTMRNIAKAIDDGKAQFLDGVRQRTQVEYLMGQLRNAKSSQLQAKYPEYGERMKRSGEPIDGETVDFAEFPRFEMFRSDLANLARQLQEVDGGKKMGALLAKAADDVTDAYTSWAKENLLRVSHFGNKADGGFAEFANKETAERAIKRSGLVGKAIVLPIKRGQNRVILSPGEAMQQGLWQGDGDKRMRLGLEFVEGLVKLGKRKGSKELAIPWQLESAYDNRKRLERMGIKTPAEFRSALRELASLQQEMGSPDRIKELERSMVGRANDGLDFFPTSPAVVQSMLDAAEITEGMAVLEPSAGMGHIADAIVADSGVWPDVVELSGSRRELLEAKGFHLAEVDDFLTLEPRRFFTYGDTFRAPDGVEGTMRGVGSMGSQRVRLEDADGKRLGLYDRGELTGIAQNGSWSGYDRIVMNPPFSEGRDIQHVMHAYSLLRPGGRIVSIMGEGAFFQSNKRAEAFRSWLVERGATNEKLPDGSFMDPSLPVNTGVAARMVVIDKPVAAVGVPDGDIDAFGALPRKLTQKGTPFDRAIMAMVQEGKPASDVLGMIANGSRDPFYRQLAKLMGKAKANPVLVFENEVKGGLAYYSAKRDALVMGPEAQSRAEQIFMHEFVHAVTIRALHQNSLPSLQMSKLYQHVKKRHGSAGYYGMKNVREFAAEAFTNPDFQRFLKNIDAPAGNIAKSAWDAFLRVLKNILGLPNNATDALSRALDIGVNVMREDMRVRAVLAQRNTPADAHMAESRTLEPVKLALEGWDGSQKQLRELAGAWYNTNLQGKAFANDDMGVQIQFSSEGRNTAFATSGNLRDGWRTEIVKALPDLIKNAVKVQESAPDERKAHKTRMMHTLVAPLEVGGKVYAAKITVREALLDPNGIPHKFYDVTALQIENGPEMFGVAPDVSTGPVHPTGSGPSGVSVAALAKASKIEPQEDVDFFSTEAIEGIKKSALDQLSHTFTHPGKVSLWDKTVGTMRNLALRAPEFKPVFESAQRFIDDVSMLANDAADAAPRLMPRVESLGDLKKKPITAADNKAVAKPLFEGTLMWARDMDGKPMLVDELSKKYSDTPTAEKAAMLMRSGKVSDQVLKMWSGMPVGQFDAVVNGKFERDLLKPGVVWTDSELKDRFGLTEQQVSLYREARGAIDRSIDMTARTDMLRMLGDEFADLRELVLEQPMLKDAFDLVVETLQTEAKERPDMADRLLAINNSVVNRYETAKGLMDYGYAPLSRFGQYTVDVVDQAGERQYFGMFESKREANLMRIKMATVFPGATVTQGTMSQQAFKLFQGITPESLEQFGSMLGLKSDGNEAKDKAFQAYLQLAKNNHSALKRLIHRKGIDGYSEDVGRVLASFVYSNARLGSGGLNAGTMETAVEAIPKEKGELRDAAMSLRSYIQDPQDEGQAIRGFLFAQYLGGSVASAAVNMMQPFQITMPWLSQYGGMANAAKQMTRALKDMGTKGYQYEPDLAKALHEAVEDGTVSPQEIHQLMAQARGTGSLRAGDGTKSGDARAAMANNWERVKVAWGQPFALAEQFNRRSTFIAAYRIAKEQGMANPGQFARDAVLETQFLYSKANKPRWARGAIGGTLFTFKTYSVSYLELMNRMWNPPRQAGEGDDAYAPRRAAARRAVGWSIAMLMLTAGAGGLPFVEDAEDLIDGAGQLMGYNISAKQWRKEFLQSTIGAELGEFFEQGMSGLPGAPIDVSGRLGLGNLIPGTGLFLSKQSRERDLLEVVGPAGDLISRGFTGARKLLTGDVAGAALEVSPNAVRNAAKGVDMAVSGMYKDTKGYKVLDTTLTEALSKAAGFQPKSVSEVQETNSFMLRSRSFYTTTSSEIKAQWAAALFEKDESALANVRSRLEAWNRNNPDQRIIIKMPDIWKRVRNMEKDRTQRIQDTSPKAIRQQMRAMAAEANQ
ncbi:PLxRFG domain-containing protein [Lampropedia aestuarii]|uniref:PLxRFG domain-containing protein n=1 Tax=Lampropedia aestuarii TaxID=2562762 RepID=A0A4S5C191_9BURK|nr:PLxRFG domain-containing protein [Lampropedia aestuarii]THJ36166.1 PLxRFG domain-containing protein [Lampropedia aestuarii]